MSQQITIPVSDEVVRQATQVAHNTQRSMEDVLAAWLESAVGELPVEELSMVINDLVALVEEEKHSGAPITAYVFSAALDVVLQVYKKLNGLFSAPAIAPYGEGGLVMEWIRDRESVRAILSRDPLTRSYVHFKIGRESAIEDLSGDSVAQRLHSLLSGS